MSDVDAQAQKVHITNASDLPGGSAGSASEARVSKVGSSSNGTWPTDNGTSSSGVPRVTLASDGTGQVYNKAAFTDTQMLTDADADNGTPSGTDGTALQTDTIDAYISVVANTDVTNADINLWGREKGTDVWMLIPGGAMDDLQDETDDRWSRAIPDAGKYFSRLYVEIDNYADGGSGTINAYLRESTV